jgi:hypothetical protein
MERVKVARALAQRVTIKPLGVVQAALSVKLNGLFKCARHAYRSPDVRLLVMLIANTCSRVKAPPGSREYCSRQ